MIRLIPSTALLELRVYSDLYTYTHMESKE